MYDQLPRIHRRLVPELADMHFPTEVLATCADCAMQPRPSGTPGRIAFTAPQRCCTYHPRLANFLAGQGLARQDIGSDKLRARLQNPDGLDPHNIVWPREMGDAYAERSQQAFGRDESWQCPYWVEGPLGCSIHQDRGSICRTWSCKSVNGRAGWATSRALRLVLKSVEDTCAYLCVQDGDPPEVGADDPAAWEAWYLWCADYVDGFDETRIAELRGEQLFELVDTVKERIAARDAPMLEVMIPTVHSWVTEGEAKDVIGMSAYSPYDLVEVPSWIFMLLSKLDGERTWREAQRATEAEVGEAVPDDLFVTLFRRGVIGQPVDMEEAIINPPLAEIEKLFKD